MRARNNPFAAQRIESLAFRFDDADMTGLLEKLKQLDYCAAIVGPHGSGKTTLMDELKPFLLRQGFELVDVFINDTTPLTRDRRRQLVDSLGPETIVILDGADLLGRLSWLRLKRRILASGGGLLITSHRDGLLPTLIECSTDIELFKLLVAELTGSGRCPDGRELEEIFRACKGDIRQCFRHLYDDFSLKGASKTV